jgi:CO dehydrogenase nickel-insertion accessory protein CooC1
MISTALRTGAPLPQITPCPLLDRFSDDHGLSVLGEDAEDDYGLPRTLTIETLEDEQYL